MLFARRPERTSRVDVCMSTAVSQTVYGVNSRGAARAALKEIRRLEELLSRFKPTSDIGRLNRAAFGADGEPSRAVRVHAETYRILDAALNVSRLSDGAFDITAAPLVSLWAVTGAEPHIPPADAITRARELVDYQDLVLDPAALSARLARKDQMVDLGGIAKGYAADQALSVYRRHGIASAMIDLGGNVALLGSKEDGAPWNVGIQDPDAPRGDCLGFLSLVGKSVVTSGDYERFFEVNARRYHHIIDPRTGYPAESGLRSVTVVADDSMTADGLSTALFVLGLESGLEMLQASGVAEGSESYHSVEALFVTAAGEIHITESLANVYTSMRPSPVVVRSLTSSD